MARHTRLAVLTLSLAGFLQAGHYATYKIHTNTVDRHASGLMLPPAEHKTKLKTPHAPKPRARANKHLSAYERLIINEMELSK